MFEIVLLGNTGVPRPSGQNCNEVYIFSIELNGYFGIFAMSCKCDNK